MEGQKAIKWGSNRIISVAGCKISAKRPLGALLEPSRTEKTKLETALERSKGNLKTGFTLEEGPGGGGRRLGTNLTDLEFWRVGAVRGQKYTVK